MVDHSELAFRMLNRKYDTQLCYTPMLHSKFLYLNLTDFERMMVENKKYKELNFWTCPQDRPLFAQFCGNDSKIVLNVNLNFEIFNTKF